MWTDVKSRLGQTSLWTTSASFTFTVKLRFTDTRLIRTPHYYRQFALSLGKESPYIFTKFIPLKTNTPLIRTPSRAPSVSVVTEIDYSYFFPFFNCSLRLRIVIYKLHTKFIRNNYLGQFLSVHFILKLTMTIWRLPFVKKRDFKLHFR